MQIGDLVYLRPKSFKEEDMIGLLVHMEQVGYAKIDSTILYDVLLTETNEVLTVSDIYFEIWKVE